ncbi:unnamed protein product [Ranitomeya imitator]|uniref:PHD-type domain-containing protein n=1 Tax=Ranitomeya imitator TaxID=111125 RepID=A0ABN9MIJ1_9NEOB|nr:unnamed protein product [Ranitomeya imitator]
MDDTVSACAPVVRNLYIVGILCRMPLLGIVPEKKRVRKLVKIDSLDQQHGGTPGSDFALLYALRLARSSSNASFRAALTSTIAKSFNPPLSEEMLPPGEWMCHRCTIRRKKRERKKELGQVNGLFDRYGRRTVSPTSDMDFSERAAGSFRALAQARMLERRVSRPGTPTSSVSTDTPNSEQNDMDEDMIDVDEEPPVDSEYSHSQLKRPFQLLIAAAMERNPTQFQLPNELTCTTALPGTSKRRRKEEMTGKNVKKAQHELDHNGLVPLPVKVCFTCSRSCRVAPLIQCDYCPLLFHMDCLDPPLTAMPTGRWMCPNHIEHIVLNQKSMTLSNRCQVFDRFQDGISQHAVKLDFLSRIHKIYPPTRRLLPAAKKNTVKDCVRAVSLQRWKMMLLLWRNHIPQPAVELPMDLLYRSPNLMGLMLILAQAPRNSYMTIKGCLQLALAFLYFLRDKQGLGQALLPQQLLSQIT